MSNKCYFRMHLSWIKGVQKWCDNHSFSRLSRGSSFFYDNQRYDYNYNLREGNRQISLAFSYLLEVRIKHEDYNSSRIHPHLRVRRRLSRSPVQRVPVHRGPSRTWQLLWWHKGKVYILLKLKLDLSQLEFEYTISILLQSAYVLQ